MDDEEEIVKILLMGDAEVGKSSMVDRFVKGDGQRRGNRPCSSYDPDVIIKTVTLDGKTIKAYIHDPKTERMTETGNPGLTSSIIYRNVDVVMLVFSVDNSHSLDALQDCWVTEYVTYQRLTDAAWLVVGNKNDKPLEFDKATLDALCARLPDCVSMYASAKTGNNIDEVFHLAIRKAYKKRAQKGALIRLNTAKYRPSLTPNNHTTKDSTAGGKGVGKAKSGCSC